MRAIRRQAAALANLRGAAEDFAAGARTEGADVDFLSFELERARKRCRLWGVPKAAEARVYAEVAAEIQVCCSWCGADMGTKPGRGMRGFSHGMCPACKVKFLQDLDEVLAEKEK